MHAIARVLVALLALSVTLAAHAQQDDDAFRFRYEGELLNASSEPISGVFALTFKLFDSEDSDEVLWSESHYVSVNLGTYAMILGADSAVPENLQGQQAFIAVEIAGIGEVVRHEHTIEAWQPPARSAPQVDDISFASIADRAIFADRARQADNCERLGGRTLQEIDRFSELSRQIVELRQQIENLRSQTQPRAGGSVTIGDRTVTLDRAGGSGGRTYRHQCPPNHVAVGITGGAGDLIDSVTLICAPLESD